MDLINLIAEIITLARKKLILACSVESTIYGCLALLLWTKSQCHYRKYTMGQVSVTARNERKGRNEGKGRKKKSVKAFLLRPTVAYFVHQFASLYACICTCVCTYMCVPVEAIG